MNEYQRRREIQLFGEHVVLEQLRKQGYSCDLLKGNHPCFDIGAYKNDHTFIISVKARISTFHTGDEKTDPYNLFYGPKKVEKAYEIAQRNKATPMWATVRINTKDKVYDAYYGLVDDLKNKKCVPMNAEDRRRHKKFGENIFDERIKTFWSNVKKQTLR